MKKTLFILLLIIISKYEYLNAAGEWLLNSDIGSVTEMKNKWIKIVTYGNARNDNINRIYIVDAPFSIESNTRFDDRLYEIDFTSGGWINNIIDKDPSAGAIGGVIIADGRNDGVQRLYVFRGQIDTNYLHESGTLRNPSLLEYIWSGSTWTKIVIATYSVTYDPYGGGIYYEDPYPPPPASLKTKTQSNSSASIGIIDYNTITCGKLRNDGLNRLYITINALSKTDEFTWFGSSYVKTDTISIQKFPGRTSIISDARNDGKYRLYLGPTFNQEFEWNGSTWVVTEIPGDYYRPVSLFVGPGRNDSKNRIYTKSALNYPYLDEASFENGGWVYKQYKLGATHWKEISPGISQYEPGVDSAQLVLAAIADGRNDGVTRLYLVNQSGWDRKVVVELTWNGSDWDKEMWKFKDDDFTVNAKFFAIYPTITPLTKSIKTASGEILSSNRTINKAYTGGLREYVFTYPQQPYDSGKTRQDKLQTVNNYFKQGSGWTTLWYKVDTPGNITIKLYTIDGVLVRTLFDGYKSAGEYSEVWTGRNDSNEIVGTGIYLVNITGPGVNVTKKICVVR